MPPLEIYNAIAYSGLIAFIMFLIVKLQRTESTLTKRNIQIEELRTSMKYVRTTVANRIELSKISNTAYLFVLLRKNPRCWMTSKRLALLIIRGREEHPWYYEKLKTNNMLNDDSKAFKQLASEVGSILCNKKTVKYYLGLHGQYLTKQMDGRKQHFYIPKKKK